MDDGSDTLYSRVDILEYQKLGLRHRKGPEKVEDGSDGVIQDPYTAEPENEQPPPCRTGCNLKDKAFSTFEAQYVTR